MMSMCTLYRQLCTYGKNNDKFFCHTRKNFVIKKGIPYLELNVVLAKFISESILESFVRMVYWMDTGC